MNLKQRQLIEKLSKRCIRLVFVKGWEEMKEEKQGTLPSYRRNENCLRASAVEDKS